MNENVLQQNAMFECELRYSLLTQARVSYFQIECVQISFASTFNITCVYMRARAHVCITLFFLLVFK